MYYGDFKDLEKITALGKVLRDKPFNIAKNPKYDRYQRGLASMIYKFFGKKAASLTGSDNKNEITQDQQLAEELHKQLIENF